MPTTIEQVDVKGKRVFLRADFNVPQDDTGAITDDRRIRLTLPTIDSVLQRGGSLVMASHLGRPAGKGFEAEYSLSCVADALRRLSPKLRSLTLVGSRCTDADAARAAATLGAPGAILLENLRFEKAEKKGDPALALALASYADIYCNDAFGASHRSDASMLALPQAMHAMGKRCVAGLLLDREIRYLKGVIDAPRKPFVAIIGGAKVSDKLAALRNLCGRVDVILIGGAMAYTFLRAQGMATGASLVQAEMIDEAQAILRLATSKGTRIELPTDHLCGRALEGGTPTQVGAGSIPDGWMGLDIGPASRASFCKAVRAARTIVWNGPVGVFEMEPFHEGTFTLAQAIAQATSAGATSVAGGGDTAAAVEKAGFAERFSHISTGGGASLEILEGKSFECLAALDS